MIRRSYTFALLFILSLTSVSLSAQTNLWVKTIGGTANDIGSDITVDADGYVYITGSFSGTLDFDPGSAVTDLISAGGLDIFIQKLDNAGDLIWAKSVGGTKDDEGFSIAVDQSGNVFITGYFQDTVDFDPGVGSTVLTTDGFPPTQGYQDIFTLKLDASGNFSWAVAMGTPYTNEAGTSIAVDPSGNVYTGGRFSNLLDFDPGPDTALIKFPISTYATFIQKLDGGGNYIWAKGIQANGRSITVDQYENVYSTGYFADSTDFDPGPDTFYLTTTYWTDDDVYVQKLNASGDFLWAKSVTGVGSYQYGYGIAVDLDGNVITTGVFEDTADFDPGTGIFNLVSEGFGDVFIQKLDSLGNFVWAKSAGGDEHARGLSIGIDDVGNIYTQGDFWVAADFDPGNGSSIITSEGGSDVFIQKLDALGNFLWAHSLGGNSDDYSSAIAVNTSGESVSLGQFRETAYFDLGLGSFGLASAGLNDIFIQKLGTVLNIEKSDAKFDIRIYPNPNTGRFTLEVNLQDETTLDIKLYNFTGQLVHSEEINSVTGNYSKQIDLKGYSKGIYYAQIMTKDGVVTKKVTYQ